MGDMGDVFNDWQKQKAAKRSSNTEQSTETLKRAGMIFRSHNAGSHLEVLAGSKTVDFWPSTGLWIVRGQADYRRRGVRKLIDFVEQQRT